MENDWRVKLEIWVVETDPYMAARWRRLLTYRNPLVVISLEKDEFVLGHFHLVAYCLSQDFVDGLREKCASIEGLWVNEYPPGIEERLKSSGSES